MSNTVFMSIKLIHIEFYKKLKIMNLEVKNRRINLTI